MALQNSSCHKYLNDVPVRLMIRNNCNLFFFPSLFNSHEQESIYAILFFGKKFESEGNI